MHAQGWQVSAQPRTGYVGCPRGAPQWPEEVVAITPDEGSRMPYKVPTGTQDI